MKLLQKICDFFINLFSRKREEVPLYIGVRYIVNQIEVMIDTLEKYRFSSAIISLNNVGEDEIEKIRKELDKRDKIEYEICTEESIVYLKIYGK